MRRRTGARGFLLGFCFTLLWQAGWGVLALVLWLLHRWLGISLYWSCAALGVWPLSALLATVFIRLGTGGAGAQARQNRNPYSADNARMFLGVANGAAPAGAPVPGEPVRTAVLVIWRKAIAQSLAQKLRDAPDLRLVFEPSHSHARAAVRAHGACAALVEVAESGGSHGVSDCLELCARLREEAPQCKLLLMCPEQDNEAVARAVEAKRAGRIDDFVFYDASMDYVASKLLAM